MTPRMAVKEIEAATSSPSASMTEATAAMAELPQIELPQATSKAILCGRRNSARRRRIRAHALRRSAAHTNQTNKPIGANFWALRERGGDTAADAARCRSNPEDRRGAPERGWSVRPCGQACERSPHTSQNPLIELENV